MSSSDPHVSSLAQQARELFVVHIAGTLPGIVGACSKRLTELLDQPGNIHQVQLHRDSWSAFQKQQTPLLQQCRQALQLALTQRAVPRQKPPSSSDRLELVAEGAMDDEILASRLAMRVLDLGGSELHALRLRVQHLERRPALPRGDVLRPDVVARILVDSWFDVQLSREAWALVQDVVSPEFSIHMAQAYRKANAFLVSSGVMEEIDFQALVRRAPAPAPRREAPAAAEPAGVALSRFDAGSGPAGGANSPPAGSSFSTQPFSGSAFPSSSFPPSLGSGGPALSGATGAARGSSAPENAGAGPAAVQEPMGGGDETRLMTGTTPLARARMRAQGVVARLKRLLTDRVGGEFDSTLASPPSAALQRALKDSASTVDELTGAKGAAQEIPQRLPTQAELFEQVEQAAVNLRSRTVEFKQAASTAAEKATIEVVALMFQSILAEERIPPSVRVWFARLQIPVLRVALAEPGFFGALQHPARRLIDRMGSCVLGFESHVGTAALEAEIRRIVQVIEQYPETGRRVFELVLEEFQTFLSSYLSEQGNTSRFVTMAQQVEQKETLAVQYTIEFRKLLDGITVRDEVRDFLFKVWVDVLSVASVRFGLQHAQTTALKQVAADLLWAASAKPNRSDRSRVIQQLPALLQRLRQGMDLLGVEPAVQDQHIKLVSDTLAQAFLSRSDPIPQERLDQLIVRLANLENVLPENRMGDLELDKVSIEMITGMDASNMVVISQGGRQPSEAMRAWAQELQIGAWFSLNHDGRLANVQLSWRSQRGQLCMFVTPSGHCYLIQLGRVASYLQAGLLVPSEDEALTVRATRDALSKLEADPQRLLA